MVRVCLIHNKRSPKDIAVDFVQVEVMGMLMKNPWSIPMKLERVGGDVAVDLVDEDCVRVCAAAALGHAPEMAMGIGMEIGSV